jgi:NADH:ubiquinone reductase (H+-translocating)
MAGLTPASRSTLCVRHECSEETLLVCSMAGPPQPFVYSTLGIMGSLGHGKAFGQLLNVRVRGVPAWFVRRTYYLLQMPGWRRRLRIMIDWTFALLFQPDIVKISLGSEDVEGREGAAAGEIAGEQEAARNGTDKVSRQLTT